MEYGHKLRRPDPSPDEIAQKVAEFRKRKNDAMLAPPKVQEADPMDWRRRKMPGEKNKQAHGRPENGAAGIYA